MFITFKMKLLSTPPDPRCDCCNVAEDVKDGVLLTQGEVGASDKFVGDEDFKEVLELIACDWSLESSIASLVTNISGTQMASSKLGAMMVSWRLVTSLSTWITTS